MRFLIDGMNVIGSRPDGWWRDRPSARRRLVAELALLAVSGAPVIVVFDGRPSDDERADAVAGVTVRWAPGGRNAADDRIAAMVATDDAPEELVVVTSDAELAGRVRTEGALVEGVSAFRARLAALEAFRTTQRSSINVAPPDALGPTERAG